MNLHDVADADLKDLAAQAEAHALDGAHHIIALANRDKVQKLYDKWRVIIRADIRRGVTANRAEVFGALSLLIAEYIQSSGEECPHCRRVETAQMFALVHSLIESQTELNQRVN